MLQSFLFILIQLLVKAVSALPQNNIDQSLVCLCVLSQFQASMKLTGISIGLCLKKANLEG